MSEQLAIRILIGLGITLLSLWVVRELWYVAILFGPVIALFFCAWLISFVLGPPANALTRLKVRRWIAVLAVYVFVFAGLTLSLVLLIPLVIEQLARLSESVNSYTAQTPAMLNWLNDQARGMGVAETDLRNFYTSLIDQVRSFTGVALQNAIGWVTGLATAMVNIVFCLIISVYIMLDGRRIVAGVLTLAPRRYRGEVRAVLDAINSNFGGFIRGQLILALVYAIGVAGVMWLARLDYITICALFAGIAMMIPFVGPFISLVPVLLVAVLTSPNEVWWVVLLLIVVQQVVLNGVGPRVFGQTVNMHPLLVIGAAMTGATVAGVWGALFGIPVAGIIASVVKRLYTLQQQGELADLAAGSIESSEVGMTATPPGQAVAIGEARPTSRGPV